MNKASDNLPAPQHLDLCTTSTPDFPKISGPISVIITPENEARAQILKNIIQNRLPNIPENHQKRLLSDLLRVETLDLERELTEEEIWYHLHFWAQHLVKIEESGNEQTLLFNQIRQTEYSRKAVLVESPDHSQLVEVTQGVNYYTENMKELVEQLRNHREELLQILNKTSIFGITNHASWAGYPIFITACKNAFGDDPDFKDDRFPDFLDRFYTILGPALMTYQQGRDAITSLSNIIKTMPKTKNGIVPGLEALQKRIVKRAIRPILTAARTPGKIILMSPSGTSDTILSDGRIQIERPDETALRLITSINKSAPTFVIGTNEAEMFENLKIKRGKEHMSLGKFHPSGSIHDPENVMEELASHIINEEGKTIGEYFRLAT